jgi:hypothetical protein
MVGMMYFIIPNAMDSAKVNYEALLGLPIVQELLRKNKKLRKENKALRNLICSLPEFRCDYAHPKESHAQSGEFRSPVNIKIESEHEPTPCDTLVDDDEVVLVQKHPSENVVYVIDDMQITSTDEDESIEDNAEEHVEEDPENITGVIDGNKAADEEAEEEEEEQEEEDEQEEEEEQEDEEEEEEHEQEQEAVVEPKVAETTTQNTEDEVFEIQISGKAYYTTNEINGAIYAVDENEDVGDEVGKFKEGKPTFYKKSKK